MRLPDFLIIGAMKAGTTTLYRDLLTNPSVFFPLDKEPGNLADEGVLTPQGKAEYASLYAGADSGQRCGDASTRYSQLPDIMGVPKRARELLGEEARIIYVVRHPIQRAVSHHRHILTGGATSETDFNRAVHDWPRLVNYSRYAMQIEPWIDAFGRDNVLIIQFERYVRDRAATVDEVSRFLNMEPRSELLELDKAYNTSAGKPVAPGPFKSLLRSSVYLRIVRPLMPLTVRERIRDMLLPKHSAETIGPNEQTTRWLVEQLADDAQQIGQLMGIDADPWDLQSAVKV